jgi:hypothetical protein
MTNDEIRGKLFSKKSPDRRRAAKAIEKNKIVELGEELYKKYMEERQDKRTWETQWAMINALGAIDYKKSLDIITEIVKENIPHDTITSGAARAYVRLKRKSINDGKPVLELLNFGSYSVIGGALEALAYDQMMPDNETIEKIIKICWDIHKHKDRVGLEYGLGDRRIYLAIACANWDRNLTEAFLNHCIETSTHIDSFGDEVQDERLITVSENSLKGKYSKSYLG